MLSSIRNLVMMPVNLVGVAMSAARMKLMDVRAARRNREINGVAGLEKIHHGGKGVALYVNDAAALKR